MFPDDSRSCNAVKVRIWRARSWTISLSDMTSWETKLCFMLQFPITNEDESMHSINTIILCYFMLVENHIKVWVKAWLYKRTREVTWVQVHTWIHDFISLFHNAFFDSQRISKHKSKVESNPGCNQDHPWIWITLWFMHVWTFRKELVYTQPLS